MILMWHHPKYYKELAKKRKQLEREQANERASEQANKRASEQANKRASEQAIKHLTGPRASSVECGPNRSLRGKAFRGDQAVDRGSSYS